LIGYLLRLNWPAPIKVTTFYVRVAGIKIIMPVINRYIGIYRFLFMILANLQARITPGDQNVEFLLRRPK